MNPGKYLRDRFVCLLCWALCVIGCRAYLNGLKIPEDAVLFVTLIIAAAGALPLIVDYLRRVSWYRETQKLLESLDQPYLLHEIMEEPSFLDGQIFYSWIQEIAYGMNERVAGSIRTMQDYREYLERWVHEIKTPIATALLTSENHPSPEMRSIQDDLNRIESCVMQVLYYARSSSLQDDYIITRTTLSVLVDDALKRNARLLIRAGFRIEKSDLDAVVYTDSKWMGFVLDQIIQNAVKYKKEDGAALRFAQEVSAEACELLIEDLGVGVPEKDLPRLFQKGFTGENGRKYTKATGMGLYISRNLLEKMNHRISAAHGTEGGLFLRIHFPKESLHTFSAE